MSKEDAKRSVKAPPNLILVQDMEKVMAARKKQMELTELLMAFIKRIH